MQQAPLIAAEDFVERLRLPGYFYAEVDVDTLGAGVTGTRRLFSPVDGQTVVVRDYGFTQKKVVDGNVALIWGKRTAGTLDDDFFSASGNVTVAQAVNADKSLLNGDLTAAATGNEFSERDIAPGDVFEVSFNTGAATAGIIGLWVRVEYVSTTRGTVRHVDATA